MIVALAREGERGVEIPMILAKQMIRSHPDKLALIKMIPHLRLQVLDLQFLTKGIQHAKFWIFDQKVFLLGSQNFDWCSLTQVFEWHWD